MEREKRPGIASLFQYRVFVILHTDARFCLLLPNQRVFLMDESLRKIRHLINHVDEDPNSIDAVRKLMGEVSRGVILLDECLLYIEEVSSAMTRNKFTHLTLVTKAQLPNILLVFRLHE